MSISIIKAENINAANQILKNFNKLNGTTFKSNSIIFRQFFKKYPLVKEIDDFNDGVFIIENENINIYNLIRLDFIEDTSEIIFNDNHIQDLNIDDEGNFEPEFFEIAILSFQSNLENLIIMALVRNNGSIEYYCRLSNFTIESINRCLQNFNASGKRKKSKTKRKHKSRRR